MKRDMDDTSVTVGSGNVFADLGVTEPEMAMKKSQVASKIRETIQERNWTQTEAAEVMGIDQPKVSAIVRGRVGDFTLDRLIHLVIKLGQSVFLDVVGPNIERNVTRDGAGIVTVRYTAKAAPKTTGKRKRLKNTSSRQPVR